MLKDVGFWLSELARAGGGRHLTARPRATVTGMFYFADHVDDGRLP